MNGITPRTATLMAVTERRLQGQGKRSYSGQSALTLFSSGESSSTAAVNVESIAQCSGMNRCTKARASYVKRMRLLIASGLIAGITPTSIRKGSRQQTLDFALSRLAGGDAEKRRKD
jgi:hypothetical protein